MAASQCIVALSTVQVRARRWQTVLHLLEDYRIPPWWRKSVTGCLLACSNNNVGRIANLPPFWQVGNMPHVAVFLGRAIAERNLIRP